MFWINRLNHLLGQGWRYLNQPLFDSEQSLILNPFTFRKNDNIQAIEKCWGLDCTPHPRRSQKP